MPLPAMVQKAGAGGVHLLGVGAQHSAGHDPLRVTKTAQLSLARGLAEIRGRKRRDGKQRVARPDDFRWLCRNDETGGETGKPLDQLAKEFVMTHRPSSVIQRAASVDEVANMVVYVCSTQASATSARRRASMAAW